MEYIKLTLENLDKEHICCAISNNKDVQVASKKAWLKERIKDGLVFLKSVERGKCFIEYIPAENAWCPVEANGYMHINCFWVSGLFKGHGYANDLLNACIADAKAQVGKKVPIYGPYFEASYTNFEFFGRRNLVCRYAFFCVFLCFFEFIY